MHELVRYEHEEDTRPGQFAQIVQTAVVFEHQGERRLAEDAPLDWRHLPVRPTGVRTLETRTASLIRVPYRKHPSL